MQCTWCTVWSLADVHRICVRAVEIKGYCNYNSGKKFDRHQECDTFKANHGDGRTQDTYEICMLVIQCYQQIWNLNENSSKILIMPLLYFFVFRFYRQIFLEIHLTCCILMHYVMYQYMFFSKHCHWKKNL